MKTKKNNTKTKKVIRTALPPVPEIKNEIRKVESFIFNQIPPPKNEFLVGRMVRIKPQTRCFIGGKGIPDSAFNSDLFISRVNPNGSVVIAYSDSLIDIDALFQNDLDILDAVRSNIDEVIECPKVSIRIFGVPERMDNIRFNQNRLLLPDDHIFIDENHDGCYATAKRAWSFPTDKEFVLVLQDDVELCDNFMKYVNIIVDTQPDSIVSLYSTHYSRRVSVNRIPTESPYLETEFLTAQGIIMKRDYIEDCLSTWDPEKRGDDVNIANWAKKNGIRILTIIPTILQHIGDISVFDPSRSMGRSEFYRKNPIDVNWANTYVTLSENNNRK